MRHRTLPSLLIAVFAISACANDPTLVTESPYHSQLPVEFSIVSDQRGELRQYPVSDNRAYLEARPGERFRVRVVNHSDRRIGVVVAVDGRNIISGRQSWLLNHERMYILSPREQAEYSGWRTGSDRVNRFYFTNAADSYAGAFGDYSAMGVIAMAVYREKTYTPPPRPLSERDAASGKASEAMRPAAPGTGYGESEYSPSRRVNFSPESKPAQKMFLKYEWRATLCRKRILSGCRIDEPQEGNRFWPEGDNDFVPPPPGR